MNQIREVPLDQLVSSSKWIFDPSLGGDTRAFLLGLTFGGNPNNWCASSSCLHGREAGMAYVNQLQSDMALALVAATVVPTLGSGWTRVTVEQARAAAQRNVIDTRMFDIREGGRSVGTDSSLIWDKRAGKLLRGPDGRIIMILYDSGLTNERKSVGSIAHELNHARSVLRTGQMSSEGTAEISAMYAEAFFK